MKFNINVETIRESLGFIQGIAERRATMPVLSHVLINASKNEVKLSATDLETTMSARCQADVLKTGSLSLPARKLYEIVNELTSEKVEFEEIGNHWVQIKSSATTFKVAGLPSEDFPVIPGISTEDFFTVKSSKMDDMISKTIFAVSPDEVRRNLSGIFFERDDKHNLKLIATDGHRLSVVESEIDSDIKLQQSVLVPKKGLSELRKMLRVGEDIKIGCGKNFFIAEGDGIVLIIRLIDSEFPDYSQVIPRSAKDMFQVEREEFLSALRRVSILSSEKTKSVRITISNGVMTLLSVSPEIGEAKEEVPVKYSGEDIELGFNARYIMDVLEVISEQTVEIAITDELSPAVIKPVGIDSFISVIMPMRV